MWASGGEGDRPKIQLLINDEEADDFWGEEEPEIKFKPERMVDADLLSLSDSFQGIRIGGKMSNLGGDDIIVHGWEEEAAGEGVVDEKAQCDIIRHEISELEKAKVQVERALSLEQPQFLGLNRKRRLKRSYDPMTDLDKRKVQIDKQLIAKRKELVKLLQVIKRKARLNQMDLQSSGSCSSSLQTSVSLNSSEETVYLPTEASSTSRKKLKYEEERENLVGTVGYSGALEDVAKEMGGTVLLEAAIRLELGKSPYLTSIKHLLIIIFLSRHRNTV